MPAPGAPGTPTVDDLLGVRSSKGRYYSEYRHSAQDLQRALQAVNAMSWVLAEAPGNARTLVDGTLPVLADLLGAQVLVLVCDHPGLGGSRVRLPAAPGGAPVDERAAAALITQADAALTGCPDGGTLRLLPQLGGVLMLAPLPRGGRGAGYVAALVPQASGPDSNGLAILGTLSNQLAGAIESSWRLAVSEASRQAAADALQAADRQARALATRNELLRQTRYELAGARERQLLAEDRQRIARDLHDSVAQQVLSMGMQVEWCRTTSSEPVVVARLTEVKAMARATVEGIRSAIFELSSSDELQGGGLEAALRHLASQYGVHGLEVDVELPAASTGPLPPTVVRTLFMVVKEALFNTVLHAEATRASVRLTTTDRQVRMEVTDDGCGRAGELVRSLARTRRGTPTATTGGWRTPRTASGRSAAR